MCGTPFCADSQIPKWLQVLQLSFVSGVNLLMYTSNLSALKWLKSFLAYCSQTIFSEIPMVTPIAEDNCVANYVEG